MYRELGEGLPDTPVMAPRQPPMPRTITTRRGYATVTALVAEYDADGALVRAREYAPHPLPGRRRS